MQHQRTLIHHLTHKQSLTYNNQFELTHPLTTHPYNTHLKPRNLVLAYHNTCHSYSSLDYLIIPIQCKFPSTGRQPMSKVQMIQCGELQLVSVKENGSGS